MTHPSQPDLDYVTWREHDALVDAHNDTRDTVEELRDEYRKGWASIREDMAADRAAVRTALHAIAVVWGVLAFVITVWLALRK